MWPFFVHMHSLSCWPRTPRAHGISHALLGFWNHVARPTQDFVLGYGQTPLPGLTQCPATPTPLRGLDSLYPLCRLAGFGAVAEYRHAQDVALFVEVESQPFFS